MGEKHNGRLTDFAYLLLLTAFAFLLYREIFTYDTFGPEFPLFYFYNDGLNFTQMLRSYTYTELMWYRPTSFTLFYWIGDRFLDWHDLDGWKFFHLWTVLAAGYAIYWLVRRCLGGTRPAAVAAAFYFIAQPSLYAFVMEVAPFDFIYIVLTVLCVGSYLLALRTSGGRSLALTACAWALFAIALTAKEMALAIPFYLTAAGALTAVFHPPLRKRLLLEIVRLLPFFALLPAYYFFHLAKMPPETLTATGPYRAMPDFSAMAANFRKFSLWIVRFYGYTGETLAGRMYQSSALNNAVGAVLFLLVAAQWFARARRSPGLRLTLLLMLAWVAVFLVMPVYAGGFIWHINLPVIGYAVLFGMAAAWWFEKIPSRPVRIAAAALCFLGALLLGRANLHAELAGGTHTTGFRINGSLLRNPPVPASRLGPAPLVYIEDRLGIGAWWYGCYGRLFNYVYLRHDIEEVIVPELASVSGELRKKWLTHGNAFFFRYDHLYRWRDASDEFRGAALNGGTVEPHAACAVPGGKVQFALTGTDAKKRGVVWSIDPPGAGRMTQAGLYTAPGAPPPSAVVRVSAADPAGSDPSATATLTFGTREPVRIAAGSGALTDSTGRLWRGDSGYDAGKTYATSRTIAGTATPALYQGERFHDGPFGYRFCVAPGAWNVTLKFAEIWFTGPGQRVFDVAINGAAVLPGFDVVKEAGGPHRAVDRQFTTEAPTGQITIRFTPVISNPKISAIELTPR